MVWCIVKLTSDVWRFLKNVVLCLYHSNVNHVDFTPPQFQLQCVLLSQWETCKNSQTKRGMVSEPICIRVPKIWIWFNFECYGWVFRTSCFVSTLMQNTIVLRNVFKEKVFGESFLGSHSLCSLVRCMMCAHTSWWINHLGFCQFVLYEN